MKVTQALALLCCSVGTAALLTTPALAAEQQGASLRGVVVDTAGRPVSGATVTIEDEHSGRVEVAMTDGEGRFRETGLAADGSYKVSVPGDAGQDGVVTGVKLSTGSERFVRLVLGTTRASLSAESAGATDYDAAGADAIVVTGSRGELARSQEVERNSSSIMSASSADAIGRFTDENAAEAARRLPGVSIINNRGEGRFVTVRGAEPSFVGFSVNGISLPSQEDDRSVALDVVPSEQLERVEVYKTLTPELEAEGIGGRVNLVLKNPLDYEEGVILGQAAAGWNEQNGDTPWSASGTIAHVFGPDREFGAIFSASYSTNPRGFESAETGDWKQDEIDGVEGWYTEELTYHDRLFTNDRLGLSGALQWQPSEGTDIVVGGLFDASQLDEVRQRVQFIFEDPTAAGPVGEGGNFTSVTFPDHRVRRRFDYVDTDRKTWSIYGSGKHDLGDLNLDYRLSYARATEVSYGPEIVLEGRGFNSIVVGMDTLTPEVEADGGADVNDPELFEYAESGVRTFDRRDREWAGEGNLAYEIGDDVLKLGFKARLREKINDTQRIRQDEFLGGDLTLADPRLLGSAPSQDSLHYDYGIGIDREGALDLLANTSLFNALDRSYQDSLLSDYGVKEDIYAGYVQYTLNSGPLMILPGVRVEHTKTTSTFMEDRSDGRDVDDPTRYQFVTLEREYTDFFPSLNVKYDVSNDLVLRGAITRSISRPKFGDLAAAREVDFEDFLDDPTEPIQVSEGNPNLEATYSWNFDAAASWYFAPASILSVSVFHKEIDGPIYSQEFDETFEGNPAEVERPVNAGKARITGVEFGYTQQFTFLPGALSGFGVNTNLTLIDSSVDVPARPDEDFRLFNQSNLLANASLIYQYGGLDGQLSLNYRGSMLTGLDEPGLDGYQGEYMTLDAKLKYTVSDNFSVYVAASNLTDEPEQTYAGQINRFKGNEHYGRNILAGVELTFGG